MQADVRPNPTVTVTGDNLVGSGRYNVFAQPEFTTSYAQTFERGGKREARVAFADRGIAVAEASAKVARLDLAAQVERAYFDVIIADEVAWAATYRLKIEREIQVEAVRRVRGYKDPLFVETRASARVAQAEIALAEAKRRQLAARNTLASFWGGSGEGLEVAGSVLTPISSPIALAPSDEALEDALVAEAGAAVTVEETRRTQDYTVSGGLRYLRGTGRTPIVPACEGWEARKLPRTRRAGLTPPVAFPVRRRTPPGWRSRARSVAARCCSDRPIARGSNGPDRL